MRGGLRSFCLLGRFVPHKSPGIPFIISIYDVKEGIPPRIKTFILGPREIFYARIRHARLAKFPAKSCGFRPLNYEDNERMVSCLVNFFNKILSRRCVGRVFVAQTDSANEALPAEAGLLHNYCAINSLSRNRFGRGSRKRVACGSPCYWARPAVTP